MVCTLMLFDTECFTQKLAYVLRQTWSAHRSYPVAARVSGLDLGLRCFGSHWFRHLLHLASGYSLGI